MKTLRLLILFFVMPVSSALAHTQWGHMMGWGHMNYWSGGAVVFLILLLGLIGVVTYFIINQKKLRGNYRHYENETVLEILKERYAKGEISREEFETMKKDLQ